ncbi:BTAD domain-containing putative transcriptional regulator [Streptomyces sp. L7]
MYGDGGTACTATSQTPSPARDHAAAQQPYRLHPRADRRAVGRHHRRRPGPICRRTSRPCVGSWAPLGSSRRRTATAFSSRRTTSTRTFVRLVGEARTAARAGRPQDAARCFTTALDLWQGDILETLELTGPLRDATAGLRELRLSAEDDLMDAHLDAGEHTHVVAEFRRLVRAGAVP